MDGGEERMRGVQIYILRSFLRIAIMAGGEERMKRGSRFTYWVIPEDCYYGWW